MSIYELWKPTLLLISLIGALSSNRSSSKERLTIELPDAKPEPPIRSMALSGSGKYLAVPYSAAAQDKDNKQTQPITCVFEVPSGNRVMIYERRGQAVAFSPNEKLLAIAVQQRRERKPEERGPVDEGPDLILNLVEVSTGEVRNSFRLSNFSIRPDGLTFSSDGKLIAAAGCETRHAGRDVFARIWLFDLPAGKELPVLKPACQVVNRVAFSPNGKMLVADTESKSQLSLWDLTTGQCVTSLEGHVDRCVRLVFSGDGKQLISVDNEGLIVQHDLATGRITTSVGRRMETICAVVPAGGKDWVLFNRAGSASLNDAMAPRFQLVIHAPNRFRAMTSSENGEWLAAICDAETKVYLWNIPKLLSTKDGK
jgi:WD40 repeat protein